MRLALLSRPRTRACSATQWASATQILRQGGATGKRPVAPPRHDFGAALASGDTPIREHASEKQSVRARFSHQRAAWASALSFASSGQGAAGQGQRLVSLGPVRLVAGAGVQVGPEPSCLAEPPCGYHRPPSTSRQRPVNPNKALKQTPSRARFATECLAGAALASRALAPRIRARLNAAVRRPEAHA